MDAGDICFISGTITLTTHAKTPAIFDVAYIVCVWMCKHQTVREIEGIFQNVSSCLCAP